MSLWLVMSSIDFIVLALLCTYVVDLVSRIRIVYSFPYRNKWQIVLVGFSLILYIATGIILFSVAYLKTYSNYVRLKLKEQDFVVIK
jgi:hypothetical protein